MVLPRFAVNVLRTTVCDHATLSTSVEPLERSQRLAFRVRTDDIDEMAIGRRSIMPETTINTLTRVEVRDLLAFLQGLYQQSLTEDL